MQDVAANPVFAAARSICLDVDGPLNGLMAAAFLVFILSVALLIFILWGVHRERTDTEPFRGLDLDSHQRAYLKSYFSTVRGRIHALVMVACLLFDLGAMGIAMFVYDIRWDSCQTVRLRYSQEK